MTTITATSILRSRNQLDPTKVLSTLLLRYPRFIHAELMTHRVFSRNAASSRAIPVQKLIDDVMADPVVPLFWGKNQKGMQADEECRSQVVLPIYGQELPAGKSIFDHVGVDRESAWLGARNRAVEVASAFSKAGYHKQVVNRLLEPFAHITVLVSSTQWANFLALRDHPDAEPHIAILAKRVREQLETAPVQDLSPGYWHLPFVTAEDRARLAGVCFEVVGGVTAPVTVKKSVACCASTSFKTVEGYDMTMDRAEVIHDRLLASSPVHASPAEHAAQADDGDRIGYADDFYVRWNNPRQHGNFEGFRQYRKMLPNEAVPG